MNNFLKTIGIYLGSISGIALIIFLLYFLLFSSCSENKRAYFHGGTLTVELPENTKFMSCAWKDTVDSVSLWYLTRPATSNETAVTYTYQEKTQKGLREGKVVFVEKMSKQNP